MKLNTLKVSGRHPQWCGPSALSIITGRTVNYCAKLIADCTRCTRPGLRRLHTSRTIRGTYNNEMRYALDVMGFKMVKLKTPRKYHRGHVFGDPTQPIALSTYMAERGGPDWKATLLVQAGNHYLVACRDTLSDNHATCHYSDHPNRLKRVEELWRIERKKRKVETSPHRNR